MKKITIFVLCMLITAKMFAYDYYIINYTLTPKNDKPLFYTEYCFDSNGVIKSIINYDITDFINFYKWKELKQKAKVLSKRIVIQEGDEYQVYLTKDGESKLEKTVSAFSDAKTFIPPVFNYGKLIKHNYKHPKTNDTIKITYDNMNEYSIETPDLVDDFEYLKKEVFFVSGYIFFSSKAKRINSLLKPDTEHEDFMLCIPTLKDEREITFYSSEGSFYTKKGSFYIEKNNKIKEKNKITYNRECSAITDGVRNIALIQRSEEIGVLYEIYESKPTMTGAIDLSKYTFIPIKKITSSSSLKEKETVYKAENVVSMELDRPWVEGVNGSGIGEYLEFDKGEANIMFIGNGFLSMKNSELFLLNNRVKEIEIKGLQSGVVQTVVLEDDYQLQRIDLMNFKNEKIRITIKSVYKGYKYDDTCINGIILVKEK